MGEHQEDRLLIRVEGVLNPEHQPEVTAKSRQTMMVYSEDVREEEKNLNTIRITKQYVLLCTVCHVGVHTNLHGAANE